MVKDDNYYLIKTMEEIGRILDYSKDITIQELIETPVVLDGIIFRMIQMSEHINNISIDFKNSYSNIDWISIKGFRNRLVHDYGGIDLQFVYNAITVDSPVLKNNILNIISK